MTKRTVVLTGCGGIPTQNVAWCLRHNLDDYRIIGVDCDKYHIHLTEGFDRKYLVPRASEGGYVETLNRVIEKEGAEFVHPQPDVEVAALSEARDQLLARTFLPRRSTVSLCHDKYALLQALEKKRIPVARSMLLEEEDDVDRAFQVIGDKIWLRLTRGAGGRGSLPVEDTGLAKKWVQYWNGWGKFSAEEYLPGRNLAWQGLFRRGRLLACVSWERIRYIISHVSPSGITGTPSVARLIDDDRVHRIGEQSIRAIDEMPDGVFGVDLKENAQGVPCVTEVNPGRFFTPSYMYAKAGYNIVRAYFQVAFDQSVEIGPRFSAGNELFWIRGIDANPVMVRMQRNLRIGQELNEAAGSQRD